MREDSKVIRLLTENRTLICMCLVFLVFAFGAVQFARITVARFATKDETRSATILAVIELEPELDGASESDVEIDTTSILYRGKYVHLCEDSKTLVEKYYDDYCIWNFIALIGGAVLFALISLVGLAAAIGDIKRISDSRKAIGAQAASDP